MSKSVVKQFYVQDWSGDSLGYSNRVVSPGEVWIDHAGNECVYRENGTLQVRTINNESSLTMQSEKDHCDVNWIVARAMKTGFMSNMRTTPLKFGDFSQVVDYHTAVLRSQEAEEAFMRLPAALRARFSNDPGELIGFLENSDNRAEAIELGLIEASPQAPQMPLGDAPSPKGEGTPPLVPLT